MDTLDLTCEMMAKSGWLCSPSYRWRDLPFTSMSDCELPLTNSSASLCVFLLWFTMVGYDDEHAQGKSFSLSFCVYLKRVDRILNQSRISFRCQVGCSVSELLGYVICKLELDK